MRQAILYQDEDGGWVAEIPSLPGCVSQGTSKDDALRNITEAAELWIQVCKDRGDPLPPERGGVEVADVPLRSA